MTTLDEAVYSKLKTDATLAAAVTGVYEGVAPAEAEHPFLSYVVGEGEDLYTFSRRVSTKYPVEIRCVVRAPASATGVAVMDRVDAILTDGTLAVTGYRTWKVRRRGSPMKYQEHDGDVSYWHVVAVWDVELAPTA